MRLRAGSWGDAHRRGRSTVLEALRGPGRWPRGSGRPGAAAETRRSTAASGRGHGGECRKAQRQPRPPAWPGRASRSPRSRLTHLGVAADAARRVGAGLGAHSQRARPVEAQAALAGRQESGQVLVARERLQVVASPAARRARTESECAGPRAQLQDATGTRTEHGTQPSRACSPDPRPRRCGRAPGWGLGQAPRGKTRRAGRGRRRRCRARARRPRKRCQTPGFRSSIGAGQARRSGRDCGRASGRLCRRAPTH